MDSRRHISQQAQTDRHYTSSLSTEDPPITNFYPDSRVGICVERRSVSLVPNSSVISCHSNPKDVSLAYKLRSNNNVHPSKLKIEELTLLFKSMYSKIKHNQPKLSGDAAADRYGGGLAGIFLVSTYKLALLITRLYTSILGVDSRCCKRWPRARFEDLLHTKGANFDCCLEVKPSGEGGKIIIRDETRFLACTRVPEGMQDGVMDGIAYTPGLSPEMTSTLISLVSSSPSHLLPLLYTRLFFTANCLSRRTLLQL